MNNFNIGDIVKIQNYNETIDDNAVDYSNLKNCIFELVDIDNNNGECPYGLKMSLDDITYFSMSELKLVCKREDRLDL